MTFHKIFIILITYLTIQTSYLQAEETCYSIALWSIPKESSNLQTSSSTSECKLLKIGSYITKRCGCYEELADAKKSLIVYKKSYKNAYLTNTLKSRFQINKISSFKNLKTTLPILQNNYKLEVSDINLFPRVGDGKLFNKNEILNMMDKFIKNAKEQNSHIENSSNFYGLSISGKYDQYAHQNYLNREYTDFEYNLKLKYSIFKDGYYEHDIKNRKQLNKINILYYKDLINFQKYNYDENLANIDNLTFRINFLYYDAMIKIYKEAIDRKETLVKSGTAAKYELKVLIHDKNKFIKLKKVYLTKNNSPINKNIYKLMQNIDEINLIDIEEIQKISKKNDANVLIAKEQTNLANISSNFYDEVNLNIYASRRAMDEVGDYDTIGAEVDIPLNFSASENAQLNTLQVEAAKIKKKFLEKHIDKSLVHLYHKFFEFQSLIQISKNDISDKLKQLEDFKTISKYNIADLKLNYEKKIFNLQIAILNLKYNIMLERVDMLKIIFKISFLSNIYDITNLLQDKK